MPRTLAARHSAPLVVAALATLLASCAGDGGARTRTAGADYPLQPIAPQDSALTISGAEDHKHEARHTGGRYQEGVTFANGASVHYEQLEGHRMVFGVTGGDVIKSWYEIAAVKQAGFVYKTAPIRRDGESFALTDSGTSRTCALYGRVFGEGGEVGNGDQLYRIVYCLPSGPNAVAATERVVKDIAARLQGTPLIAKPVPKLQLTPPAATAPSATPPALPAPRGGTRSAANTPFATVRL